MQEIILTVGIPASGKDTWANKMVEDNPGKYVVVNRDIIRVDKHTSTDNIHDYKFTKAKESSVTDYQEMLALYAISQGKSVIVSDTNLNVKTRSRWEQLAADLKVSIRDHVIDTSLHTCIKRNSKRNEYVPESVLICMQTSLRSYLGKYVHDHSNPKDLPECVIVDIDGTLASMKGIRTPFEWDKVGLDTPRKFVCNYVRSLYYKGVEIFIFSGRDSCCRKDTISWLGKSNIGYSELFMREEGSQVNDTLVKEEMFNKFIKGKYHVTHIVDDRKAVCQMWESMGFNVMNVGGFLADF